MILNTQSRDGVKTGWHKVHTKYKTSKAHIIILPLPVDISFLDNKEDICHRYFGSPELSYTPDWLTKTHSSHLNEAFNTAIFCENNYPMHHEQKENIGK